MKINKELYELGMCYVKQYGFDVVIDKATYLDIRTITRLNEIIENDK